MKKTCGMCTHYSHGCVSFMGEDLGECLAKVPLVAKRKYDYTKKDWPADSCEAFELESSYAVALRDGQ